MNLFSCFRRREAANDERPLLQPESETPSPSHFVALGDAVGAFNAGKLPSQEQLSTLLQHALRSDLLARVDDATPLQSSLKELIHAILRAGLEKNYDDKIQEFVWLMSTRADEFEVRLQGPGALDELGDDATRLLQSLQSVSKLALTSAAFRMFISDVLSTAREVVSEAASQVGEVAGRVHDAAVEVAKAVELSDVAAAQERAATSYALVQEGVTEAQSNIGSLGEESAARTHGIIIARIQELVSQARKNPEHREAIRTIFSVFRKHLSSPNEPVNVRTQVDASPSLHAAMQDLKVLLERFASNHSLDPLIHAFHVSVTDIFLATDEARVEIRRYFAEIESWFGRALNEAHFATSSDGARSLEQLYKSGRAMMDGNTQWAKDVSFFIQELQSFLQSLESDTTTQLFVKALHNVSAAFSHLIHELPTRRDSLSKDMLAWLLPRILRSIHSFPMPRIEFKNSTFEFALDFLLVTAADVGASLAPDHICVANQNQLVVDMTAGVSTSTSSRTRVHFDGLRCRLHGLSWYLKYTGFISYADQGLLDIDIGKAGVVGDGLEMDVELEQRQGLGVPRFHLIDATANIPGLSVAIRRSNHWIVNKLFVQPLASPAVHWLLRKAFRQRMENAVLWADHLLAAVLEEAEHINRCQLFPQPSPTLDDYLRAVLATLPTFLNSHSGSITTTETSLEVTTQGVIQTTLGLGLNFFLELTGIISLSWSMQLRRIFNIQLKKELVMQLAKLSI
ncbi:hypothetical protein HMN09_00958800 [Mycena chlorophos]|uniref:HAM1-like N-terminal domain-containing protein n=1 Tax=Mycena chlorophos TaxID=658473 RepID=A0A8H6W658_MYCCL|nr:hypothetical protein HMN09_00958800 [Mycena chlorophos]